MLQEPQHALGLDELFASVKFSSKIGYDLTGIVRLLTYGRLLDPASKAATMDQNDKYHGLTQVEDLFRILKLPL